MERSELLEITSMPTASDFQVDIFSYCQEQLENYQSSVPTNSLVVEAVAGSGKTTTIVALSKMFKSYEYQGRPLQAVFLSFNRSIAKELESRLPREIEAKTLNSLGYAMYRRYATMVHGNVEIDAYKVHKLVRKLFNRKQVQDFGEHVRFLVNMCKSLGVVPTSANDCISPTTLTDSDADLKAIGERFGKFIPPQFRLTVFAMVRKVLTESLMDETTIDFDDQKYMTVVKRPGGEQLLGTKYDVIIIDEVQDVNAVDINLIQMVLKENGLVIGVGDSRQAIYGFRGADTEAISKFQTSFNANTLPLSITYRCGKEIVKHAQELVPDIQAADSSHDGELTAWPEFVAGDFLADDLILCRNNAPLINFAFRLIANRVPVFVKGRDIGKNLISLIESLASEEKWVDNPWKPGKKMKVFDTSGFTVMDLMSQLRAWEANQIAMILDENPDNQEAVDRISDIVRSVKVFAEINADGMISSVIDDIASLFDTKSTDDDETSKMKGKVVLSTVHKAKGLEADRVFMLGYGEYFYRSYVRPDSWQMEQERNLDYVARTRAKSLYCYIDSDGMKDGSKTEPKTEPKSEESVSETVEIEKDDSDKSPRNGMIDFRNRLKAVETDDHLKEVALTTTGKPTLTEKDLMNVTGDPRYNNEFLED